MGQVIRFPRSPLSQPRAGQAAEPAGPVHLSAGVATIVALMKVDRRPGLHGDQVVDELSRIDVWLQADMLPADEPAPSTLPIPARHPR